MENEETLQDQLFLSIRHRDTDQAKRILTEHPELINAKRRGGWKEGVSTPLIEACRLDLHEVVIFLLDNGADVSATGNSWLSIEAVSHKGGFGLRDDIFPLFVAADHCVVYEEHWAINALLAAGADVNQRTAIGQTVLHVLCTFSPDDEDAQIFKIQLMKTLIEHGADVNICDHHGKSPLHYACQHGNKDLTMILLRNGANVFQEDKVGLTALDHAAGKDYPLAIALMDKYSFPIEQIIGTYECFASKAPDRFGMLRKAALLREANGIPKNVLPPLECYGFLKEWQTIEELEKYGDTESLLCLQSLLAKERISVEWNFDIILGPADLSVFDEILQNDGTQQGSFPKYHFNSLFRHQVDRFLYFGKYLYFTDLIQGGVGLGSAVRLGYFLSTDVLVKFVQAAIESCCAIQDQLNFETKPGCVKELINAMKFTLQFIGGVVLHLIKRSNKGFGKDNDGRANNGGFENNFSHRIAKVMVVELLHKCPVVSAPFYAYTLPVTHFFFKNHNSNALHRRLTNCCSKYNYQFMKMLVEAQCDINATDSDGNTLLHIVISEVTPSLGTSPKLLDMVQTLLNNGAYPHAKNKRGKCPADRLPKGNLSKPKHVNVIASIIDLLAKYDFTLTLTYMAAMKIKHSQIPYKNVLPQALVKFVDLH